MRRSLSVVQLARWLPRKLCSSALLRPAGSAPPALPATLLPPSAPVARNGLEDRVVHLNVGGTAFVSLRSTVQRSPVLARALERAEAQSSLRLGEAVFIDRDPTHFGTLLNHMRNEAEGILPARPSSASARLLGAREGPIPLPMEASELRALYVEAAHFGLEDLSALVCSRSTLARIMSKLQMAGNPFDSASRLIGALRQGAMLIGGAGLVVTTAGNATHSRPTPPADADAAVGTSELGRRSWAGGEGLDGGAPAGASAGAMGGVVAAGASGVAASAREAPSEPGGGGRDDAAGIRRGVAATLHAAADQLEKGLALGEDLIRATGGRL